MKREILFRGFCPSKIGKQLHIITLDGELPFGFHDIRGDWVYGDLIHNIDCVKVRERETDINRIAKSYEVIPETVGQYTGLKDKNGKEIYEGDIIKLCDTNPILFRVETILARYGYKTVFKLLEDGTIAQCYFLDKCEVVGNIYENPELHCGHEKTKEVDDFVKNVFDRLAAYEDSGLSPEEVQSLAQAKVDGRLKILPAKPGDTIYRPEALQFCWVITQVEIYEDEIVFIDDSDNIFRPDDIGKTVFLTREEAEKAQMTFFDTEK